MSAPCARGTQPRVPRDGRRGVLAAADPDAGPAAAPGRGGRLRRGAARDLVRAAGDVASADTAGALDRVANRILRSSLHELVSP